VASSDWDSSGTPFKAVTVGVGALRVITLATGSVGGSEVGLAVELGPCARFVGGDVTLARHSDFYSASLGSGDTKFWGFEGGMQVRVKDITAAFQLYNFPHGSAEVPGLTKTQAVASVNLRAVMFTGK